MAGKTLAARYSEVVREIKEHEGAVGALKEKAETLRAQLLAQMQRDGISKISCEGLTHYTSRQIWAGRADGICTEAACDALKAAGYGEYVKENFSTQSLSAYIREMRDIAAAEFPDDALAGENAAERWVDEFIRETGNTMKVTGKIELKSRKG